MGDKLNPFQSFDDGTEQSQPYDGYSQDPPAPGKGKKKKGPARASKALPEPIPTPETQTNPFNENSTQPSWLNDSKPTPTAPQPAPNPFVAQPNPFAQPQQQKPPNPFTDTPAQTQPSQPAQPTQSSQPSWLGDSKPASSSYYPSSSSSQPAHSTDISQREADLLRREQELDARERALEAREAKLGKTIARIPNWPRWPKPFLHHDIYQDIPSDKRSVVRQAYIFWFVKFLFVIWNLVVVVGLLILGGKVGDLILAIFYLCIWNVILFLNYRLLYQACRRRSALKFVFFMFWFGLEILCYILWTVGIRGSGMAGVLWMIWCFNNSHHVLAFMCLVNVIFCAFAAIFDFYLWIRARSFYSVDGGNAAAKKQVAKGVAQTAAENPEVAVNVATTVTPPFASGTNRQTGY